MAGKLVEIVKNLSANLGIWYLIILNAFGVLAIICKICEYQAKKRSTMFTIAILANVCWVLYFAFYGDAVSALTCFINTVKLCIFSYRGKYKWAESIVWLYVFIALQATVSVLTYTNWKDIITTIAGFLGIFAYFFKNQKTYRLLSFIHMSVWVLNSIIKFYPIALISDSISVASCAVAIYRFDIRSKQRRKE